MGQRPSYPIRHHHRLGPLRSSLLVVATSAAGALTGLGMTGWYRRRAAAKHPPRNPAQHFLGGVFASPTPSTVSGLAAAALTIAWLRRPAGGKRPPLPFAVIDTETTGLDDALDRVIELAVVYADGLGLVGDAFTWRTRPEDGRHGAEHIHHISETELAGAPTFSEIAGELATTLRGRTLVAHNAPFDTRFLAAEYRRAERRVPAALLRPLCTLDLASHLGMAPLRLSEVARVLGSPLPTTAHRATDDAEATAQLLTPLLDRAGIAHFDEVPLVDGTLPRSAERRRQSRRNRRTASSLDTPAEI